MAFTKIVSPGIDTTGSYIVQELNTVGIVTAGTVQVGAATTVHTTGIDLGSGNITSHNINSTGIISATSFVGPVTGNITGDITATSGTFSGNVSIGGTLTYEDVTNIDSVGIITAQAGIHVTGGDVSIQHDSGKFTAGAGDDLQIYHTGNHSRILESGPGKLQLGSDTQVEILNAGFSVPIAQFNPGGSVVLRHNTTTRLETTTTGATITSDLILNHASGDKAIRWATGGTNKWSLYHNNGAGALVAYDNANNAERLRITSAGQLLLGTSTARAVGGESNPRLHLEGSGATSNSWMNITRFSANNGSSNIQFAKSRSDTPGTYTVVQDGDNLGQISFLGADGTDMANYAALIRAQVDGTPGSNDMPGRLVFSTTADGGTFPTERLRIDSSGRTLIALNSSLLSYAGLQIKGDADNGAHICLANKTAAPTSGMNIGSIRFTNNAGGIGSIIGIEGDGTWSAGSSYPSRIIFATTASGATSPTERLRITSAGQLNLAGNMQFTAATPELEFNNGGPRFRVPAANTLTIHTGGGLGATSNERLRITSSGDVAIGADAYGNVAPLSKLHVSSTGTTTAIGADHGYLRSSCQILCQASDNADNSKSGIMFSGALHSTDGCSAAVVANHESVGENSEKTSLSFYTSHNETLKESLKITSDAQFEMNGVRNIYQSFSLVNNTTYNWDFTVPSEGGYGNSFYLVAGYNHYYTTSYGAHRTVWFSARGTSVGGMGNGIEQYHSQSGSWTFSKPNNTTVRITKTGGTYGGTGYGFFHLMYNHF